METNIIYHEGKPCIKARVVMLPTKKAENCIIKDKVLFYSGRDSYFTQGYLFSQGMESYHLYFITDDEVNFSDYAYYPDLNKVMLFDKGEVWDSSKQKKIVATTDTNLIVSDGEETTARTSGFKQSFEKLKMLPQPSHSFIEAYCKAGGIDEVLIELNDMVEECALSSCMNSSKCCCDEIKTDSIHNTITIHPIKNSWSREELDFFKGTTGNHIEWIYQRMINTHRENPNYDYMIKLKQISNWIKENL